MINPLMISGAHDACVIAKTKPITPKAPPASSNELSPINLKHEMIATMLTITVTIKLSPREE